MSLNKWIKCCNNKKNDKVKKIIEIISVLAVTMGLIVCFVVFLIFKIPSKYYGTYVNYFYLEGTTYKTTYKIKPFSIEVNYSDLENNTETTKLKYRKNGDDLIVDDEYFIIEDDKLYINSSKDISFLKNNDMFSWNIKSQKNDIYVMNFESERFIEMLEFSVDNWSRQLIYNNANYQIDDDSFYILVSDEQSDESDLKQYSVNYEAAGGSLDINFDRKTQKINSIHYTAIVNISKYYNSSANTASVEDIFDSRAMFLSAMAILNSNNKYNIPFSNDNYENLAYHTTAVFDYEKLMENQILEDEDKKLFSLNNERYNVSYEDAITIGDSFILGHISWDIYIK